VKAVCGERERVRALLVRRADDSISSLESRSLKAHLLSCAACAEEAAAEDPTLLFVPLAASSDVRPAGGRREDRRSAQLGQELEAEADRVVADVLAAVEVERSRRRLGSPAKNRRALLAASVALVGAGLLGYITWKSHGSAPGPAERVERVAAQRVAPAALSPAPALRRPVIEDLKNPGATVYEFASASPQEPTLVFIVDRNADI
jgi:hypothetical protein